MGYWASAVICFGFDVSSQSPDWYDDEELDDVGEFGTRLLLEAEPDSPIIVHHDSFTGTVILSAFTETIENSLCVLRDPELPEDVAEHLARAAEPHWYGWAKFD